MAIPLTKLDSELYELATEFPQLKPSATSGQRFTSFCPVHGFQKPSDLVWSVKDSDVVINCKVCGALTLDDVRNP